MATRIILKSSCIIAFWFTFIICESKDLIIHPKYVYGRYGIQYSKYLEGYKKYVGTVFTYLPSSPPLPEEKKQEFYGEKGRQYEIVNIKAHDDGDRDMDLIFFYREKVLSDATIRTKVLRNQIFNYDRTTSVYQIPFVFMDKIEKEINEAKGKTINDVDAKNTFEIIDVKFELFDKDSYHPHIIYYVKDSITGNILRISHMDSDYKGLNEILFAKENIISLESVEKPSDIDKRYGETKMYKQSDSNNYVFQDDIVKLEIIPDRSSFNIDISNISSTTIKIIWDEASFINTEGVAAKVSHSGIKYEYRNNPQIPSTIINGATVKEKIIPNTYAGWHSAPLFNDTKVVEQPKTMTLMIPIQIKEVINEYVIKYKIDYKFTLEEVLKISKGNIY